MAEHGAATRPVHLLHDAKALARMLAVDMPCCSHVAMSTQGPAAAFAAFVEGNPLAEGWVIDAELPTRRIVSWSGTLADGLFDDEPRTWMRAGQQRFAEFLDGIAPALEAHRRTLCLRPHHRHAMGDVHACMRVLRERAGGPFEVMLAPADMMAPSMLAQAEDHLARMFAHLGPTAAAVLLSDAAETPETAETGLFSSVRFGEGRLPHALVAQLLADHVPPETPVILLPGAIDAQRAALGL
ncbi:MAG: hypothetical protein ACKOYN_04210 [Planctomycetota bacterium]